AVAAGTMLAAELSRRLGYLTDTDVGRIAALFERARLPVKAPALGVETYMSYMEVDKKVEGGRLRFVLLKRLGEAFVTADVPADVLRATLDEATA
ncbi:MAG: 3-dehydroquinate synthase, partial [Thiobacillaceae bacterium]